LRRKADPIVWHDLRHAFGTMAVCVAPVTDVKEWMGHAHLSTTMRYVHYIPRHEAGKLLTQAFARDPVPGDRGAGVRASF
jgi:integrase